MLVLIVAPPLVVQREHGSGVWMPGLLANVASGTATDVAAPAAVAALVARAIINGGSDGSHKGDVVPCSPFRAALTLILAERFVWFTAREQS